MSNNALKIKKFYHRWNINLNDMDSWLIFKKRVSNSLSVFGMQLSNIDAEKSFFNYIGEIHDFTIGISLGGFFEKISDSKIYKHFIAEEDYKNFMLSIQAIFDNPKFDDEEKILFYQKIKEATSITGIGVEVKKIRNDFIIYPKGAKLLDEGLVNDVMNWLKIYPEVYEKYKLALSYVGVKGKERIVLDNLRFSLEIFLKQFLNSNKNFENQKIELGKYLKKNSQNVEIQNLFWKIFDFYEKYQNNNVKHEDKIKENEVELILYQTGIIFRFLLSH